ncbi:MAG: hypothetical protein HYW86_05135 [Candidatus Roizmanbacteria bacterium]|nr:MAG: hypothetical protein HYW86_05135 [Candidatus Roizmanbacteria bacterium]
MGRVEFHLFHREKTPTPELVAAFPQHVGLQGRLLLGGEALNPVKKDLYEVTERTLGKLASHDYKPLNNASTGERTDYWDGKEGNIFSAQKRAWVENTVSIFQNTRGFFANTDEGKKWTKLYRRFGIETLNVKSNSIENFYHKYFTGPYKQSDIKRFVFDILAIYRDPQKKTLDYKKLQEDLESIQWIANIFGATSAEIIGQLIDAEVKLQTQPKDLIKKVNEQVKTNGTKVLRINHLTQDEERLLRFLWEGKEEKLPGFKPSPEWQDPIRPRQPTPTTEDINRFKIKMKHVDNKATGVRDFPDSREIEGLTDPLVVAYNLKRLYPARYAQDVNALAENVRQEHVHFRGWLEKIHLPPNYYVSMMTKNLREYAHFLEKTYRITIPEINNLKVVPLYGKSAELWNPTGTAGGTLAFVNPRYPVIFLDFDVINQHAFYLGEKNIEEMTAKEFGKIIEKLLNEIQPHEYTHLLSDIANWHLIKDEGTPQEQTTDIVMGKLGLLLLKPTPPKVSREERLNLKERGRALMEALTVELTEQWLRHVKNRSLALPIYTRERQLLNTLINQISKERNVSREEVLAKFVEAYFKPHGFKHLADYLSGKKIDRTQSKFEYDQNRKHFMQIIYALIEYESQEAERSGIYPDYSITKNYITGSLSLSQKAQIELFLRGYSRAASDVQLTPQAIEEIRNVISGKKQEKLAA